MARKYTILILPHARTRFRKLHVSRGFVYAIGVAAVLLLVAGLALPQLAFRLHSQSSTVAELEQHNLELREEKLRFEASLDELNQRLGEFESQARTLARELGIDQLDAAEPAAGGSADGLAADDSGRYATDLDALQSRTDRLDASFGQIDDAWQERERILASTPAIMPVRGWFSHGYGWRKDPFTGSRAFHRGVDIVAPAGTSVKASADGVVTKTGRFSNYGKRIDVSHGFGYVSRYAHLSEILVRPGQRIKRGDVIGRVGSTGRSTGPHLHYEVFRDGRHVNPWRYLGDKGF